MEQQGDQDGERELVEGAKPAPGICFERVNSAGDPYGNCGKDSKSSFAKCEPRDAKCGKIQCQGGANRPVIGTNAVSIETNIPLQEGGKILCRGTHVYLGDDMPDPGLVLAGTKCEDGKVCNNKKNCHCEADWAPPWCDSPGFGGSVDSGPLRQADDSDGGEEEIPVCGEDLELNPFDGLPYSSRYYKLLKEREELPIWKEKSTFMESLLHNQIVMVSGDAKTGKSSQEIEKAYQMIREEQPNLNPDLGELIPIPLYPSKPDPIPRPAPEKQKCCKTHRRKVLLTTSLGESLIWIKNVTFVIDVGVQRRKVYNPRIRADSVLTQPISKSQAEMHKQILGMSPSAPPGTEEIALTCWRRFSHPAGDHFTLINIFNAFRDASASPTDQELVPQYYFSNLPPSESKDILQEVINHLAPAMKEEQKSTSDNKENEEFPTGAPSEQRCVIQ
ncbi:hypothetical protein WISP_32989 [Willisornis vidua]|uniref:ADAM cysteine-rich domain-containing protein n=1 Tax=Willisornis vidua TaxID=1566151 RepID=A0ABQ9DP50_9PASS|nr:hypothetical protein WISP_32989 [Willisornis vidua]